MAKFFERNETDNKKGFSKGKFNRSSDGGKGDIKFVKGDRRRHPVDDNTKNMRRLYNRLMQKQKDAKKEVNKVDIVNKIMKAVNGNYAELCFKHDGCRVLQGSVKYGDKKQRFEIIKHLIPHVYDLVTKKYSIYLALKMFKYAEHKQREEIVKQAVYPNFVKLIKSANGQQFLNFVYDNSSHQIQEGLANYYINKYLKISEDRIKSLRQTTSLKNKEDPSDPANDAIIVEKEGTFDQENVRNDIKSHLEKQLEKAVHKCFVFQAFLNKIFDYLDSKTKVYVAELFDDDLIEFLQNKQGIELSCKMFTVANAKTRKKIIKKLKDSLKSLMSNENSVLFLIKVILFNDDTKLVEKHIVKFVMEQMNEELMQNKIVLKILSNIITPFNPRMNNSSENKILKNNEDSGSKKDAGKRHEELIALTLDDIFNAVNPNIKFFLSESTYSGFLIELISLLDKNKEEEKLEELLKNIVSLLDIDYKNNYDEINTTLLAEKNAHFVLNRIMKLMDNDLSTNYKFNFYKGIASVILNNLDGYLNTKAIFLIVRILENEISKKLLLKDIQKFKNLIKTKSTEKDMKGFEILNKILNK